MTRDYIKLPPRESAGVDAYNLLLGSINGDDVIIDAYGNHAGDTAIEMLAASMAWLTILMQAMPDELREHFLAHFREIACDYCETM
jgi:hypothetical protein